MPKPQIVDDVMTRSPRTLSASASVRDAAEEMQRASIGAVVVESNGTICGIVTDRDIVVRCVASGGNANEMKLEDICSSELVTLSPRDAIDNAIELMRSKAVRRLPVLEDGRAVGMVSLGDLALARDPKSALGGISAAPPNM